jgi:redox-sensitive bicupin YhaK (pirin superfamily)
MGVGRTLALAHVQFGRDAALVVVAGRLGIGGEVGLQLFRGEGGAGVVPAGRAAQVGAEVDGHGMLLVGAPFASDAVR